MNISELANILNRFVCNYGAPLFRLLELNNGKYLFYTEYKTKVFWFIYFFTKDISQPLLFCKYSS